MCRREQGWKDEKGSEPRCVELIGDGADEAVGLRGRGRRGVDRPYYCSRSRWRVMAVISNARADRRL